MSLTRENIQMQFNRYDSLTNLYNTKNIIEFQDAVPSRHMRVITEKIHGANFQFKSTRPVCGEEWPFRVGRL